MYGISRFFVTSINNSAIKNDREFVIIPIIGKTEKDSEMMIYMSPL